MSLAFLVSTGASLFAADFVWTGTLDKNWNNPGNWSGGEVPVSHANDDQVTFADFGRAPLTVHAAGPEPFPYMMLNNLVVASAAKADLTFLAANLSFLNDVVIEPGGGCRRVVIDTRNRAGLPQSLRLHRDSTWFVAPDKVLAILANLGNSTAKEIAVVGGGSVEFLGDSIGRATEQSNNGVSFVIHDGATFSFGRSAGRPVQLVSTIAARPDHNRTWFTIKSGATLEMDVGNSGHRLEYVRGVGLGTTEPFQPAGFDWLHVERGARLKLNPASGFKVGEWFTLFRNVNEPVNPFNVVGLEPGFVAHFRHHEYAPGLRDYQVMITCR